ncbi:hypothetical protein ACFL6D_04895, partial [Spirochaetota bacterium]
DVPIINPAAYLDWENIPLSPRELTKFKKGLAKSVTAADILFNAKLRTRPYEIHKGETDSLFEELNKELVDIVERGCNFKELTLFMKRSIQRIQAVPKTDERYPKVSMFGEIFVRCHTGANQESIRMLEENKLEVSPKLVSDMFQYNNQMQRAAFWKEKDYKKWLNALIKGLYLKRVEKVLYQPFKEYLSDRTQKNPIELYKQLMDDNIFHIKIKGEAGISIGESYEFINSNLDGICGIYQLNPFGCMQECVATSKIQSLIDKKRASATDSKHKIIPYLNGVFGDSELPNLEAEMAMFSEKCHTRRELHLKKP